VEYFVNVEMIGEHAKSFSSARRRKCCSIFCRIEMLPVVDLNEVFGFRLEFGVRAVG
jgi:hypothetical protein